MSKELLNEFPPSSLMVELLLLTFGLSSKKTCLLVQDLETAERERKAALGAVVCWSVNSCIVLQNKELFHNAAPQANGSDL